MAINPEFVIENVNKFSTEMMKASSSTSKMTDSKHTAMHDTHAPLIGTWEIGDSYLNVSKNKPSLANE